ncbi:MULTISPECIES: hypothetical protein [Streptomyces]|uniref:hypothetical protein n=1 Tax=Streptomyces TaxID=1883 RepID=UPI00345C55A0
MTRTIVKRTALYRLFGANGQLLYIGIAYDPESRWAQHSSDKPWWPLVARRDVEWHPDRRLAEDAERAAIWAEAPLYNAAGSQGSLLATHFPTGGLIGHAEARLRISDLLNGTQFRGEHAEITRHGKAAGYLVPPDWYVTAAAAVNEVADLRAEVERLRPQGGEGRRPAARWEGVAPARPAIEPPVELGLSPAVAALDEDQVRLLAGQAEVQHQDWGREIRRELRGTDPRWIRYAIVEAAAQAGYVDVPGQANEE